MRSDPSRRHGVLIRLLYDTGIYFLNLPALLGTYIHNATSPVRRRRSTCVQAIERFARSNTKVSCFYVIALRRSIASFRITPRRSVFEKRWNRMLFEPRIRVVIIVKLSTASSLWKNERHPEKSFPCSLPRRRFRPQNQRTGGQWRPS